MIKVKPILKNLNITQIVSIDDEHNHNFIERISIDEIENYTSFIEMNEQDKEYLYDSGILTIGELTGEPENDNAKSILSKINEYCEKMYQENNPLISLRDAVEKVADSDLVYKELQSHFDLQELKIENTLWILDRQLQDASDNLYKSISAIMDKYKDNINIYTIYTQETELEYLNESWNQRYQYLIKLGFEPKDAEKLAYEVHVLVKPKNAKTPISSVFKKVVIDSIIGHIFRVVFQGIEESKLKVIEQFSEFAKTVDLQQLSTFGYNMENEGEHNIYKSLRRVMDLMEMKNYVDNLSVDENYINAFKKCIIDNNGLSQREQIKSTLELINKEYEWSKFQYIDTSINLGYEDIQFGDVYAIDLTDYYRDKFDIHNANVIGVLITQSCDCIVRKSDRSRKKQIMELLIFEEQNGFDGGDYNNLYQKGVFLFNKDSNNPVSYVLNDKFKGILHIDAGVLDLTTFNRIGEARILSDEGLVEAIEIKKPVSWIKQEVAKAKMSEQYFLDIPLGMSEEDIPEGECKNCILALRQKAIEERNGIKINYSEKQFLVQRIGRLTYNNAHIMLNYYINDIGRIGKESPISYGNGQ